MIWKPCIVFEISGKKLRYTMELLACAFPSRFMANSTRKRGALKNGSARSTIFATAQVRCQQWLDVAVDVAETDYVQRILAEEQQRLEQRRQDFLAWCSGRTG